MLKNLYDILQISYKAEPEVVAAAYRALAMKYHPDKNPTAEANGIMTELNEAYAILGNSVRREEYDRVHSINIEAEESEKSTPKQNSSAKEHRSRHSDNFEEEMAKSHRKSEQFSGISGLYYCSSENKRQFFRFFSDGLVLIRIEKNNTSKPLPEVKIDRMKGDSFNYSGSYWHVQSMIEFDTYSEDGPVSYSGHVDGSEIFLTTVSRQKENRKELKLQKIL